MTDDIPSSLSQAACLALAAADPKDKCRLTHAYAALWREGRITELGEHAPPARPGRPARPELLPPNKMPKRAYGGDRGRIGLIHALAHIELNAIDLGWDMVARFGAGMPKAFLDDWVQLALDEALHFELLEGLLNGLGAAYGDLPAHDGLWQAAEKTADDAMARLVVVPMTLEARGVDTTPATIARLERNGDTMTPPALRVIYEDEIRHVATGLRWFRFLAERTGQDAKAAYHALFAQRYRGLLKAPFNHEGRARAGFPKDWYEELAAPPNPS